MSERTALPSWRARGFRPEQRHDAVIIPDRGVGRLTYFEPICLGETLGRFTSLAEAKRVVAEIYGDLPWRLVRGDQQPHHDRVWGDTVEFNEPTSYYAVDTLPRLGVTSIRKQAGASESYVRQMAGMMGKKRPGHKYASFYDLIADQGKAYPQVATPAQFKAKGYRHGKMGNCYQNSALLAAERRDLTYVEGVAGTKWMPLPHAWCVDREGTVYDPTWLDGADYFGVPVPTDWLLGHLLQSEVYGLFGGDPGKGNANYDLLKSGVPRTAALVREAIPFLHLVTDEALDPKPMTGFEHLASYHWVHPQVATGGAMRYATDLRQIARKGVTVVVSGRRDFEDEVLVEGRATGIAFLSNPTPDNGDRKPTSWFAKAIDACLPALRRGEKVYVHCHAGMNRGPSLAYAVLRAYTGWDHDRAFAAIKSAREAATLAYVGDADRALVELGYAAAPADTSGVAPFRTLTGATAAWYHGASERRYREVADRGHFPADYAAKEQIFGPGVYLTSSIAEARSYGAMAIPVRLGAANPLVLDRAPGLDGSMLPPEVAETFRAEMAKATRLGDFGKAVVAAARAHGHDALVFPNRRGNADWCVVFDPADAQFAGPANWEQVLRYAASSTAAVPSVDKTAGARGDLPEGLVLTVEDGTWQGQPSGKRFVISRLGGEVVGHLGWWIDFQAGPMGHQAGQVFTVGVDTRFQRQGIATAMWQRARQEEPRLHHSHALTDDGKVWSRTVSARTAAGPTTLYRGIGLALTPEIKAALDRWAAMPMEESERNQHFNLGPLFLKWLTAGHVDGYGTVGLGRHWTTDKYFAEKAADTMGPYGNSYPVVITATWDGSGLDEEYTGVGGVRTPGFTPWASEKEVTLRPGTPLTVTAIELVSDYRLSDGKKNVLKAPVRVQASASHTAMPVGPPPSGIRYLHTSNYPGNRHPERSYNILGAVLGGELVGYLTWGIQGRKVQSIWVKPEFRRRRIAETMFGLAKGVDPNITHHVDRTDAGDAWVRATTPGVPARENNTTEDGDAPPGNLRLLLDRLLDDSPRAAVQDLTPLAVAAAAAPWRPIGGMFAPGQDTLDPRVFDLDTNQMRADVRDSVLGALAGYWDGLYPNWRDWTKVYLTGSGASFWWDSDADFDVLMGVDLAALRRDRPANKEVSDEEILATLNRGLKEDLRPTTENSYFLLRSSTCQRDSRFNSKSYDSGLSDTKVASRPPASPESRGSLSRQSAGTSTGKGSHDATEGAEGRTVVRPLSAPGVGMPLQQSEGSVLPASPSTTENDISSSRSVSPLRPTTGSSQPKRGAAPSVGRSSSARHTSTTTTPAAPGSGPAGSASVGFSAFDATTGSDTSARTGSKPPIVISQTPPEHAPPGYEVWGPVAVTWFVNANSYDIRNIQPYAAYDITADAWVVHPPVLDLSWDWDDIPASTWRRVDQMILQAQAVLALPEPARTQAGIAMFDWVHEGRRVAYTPGGQGWLDPGNVVYQSLSQHPDRLLRRLYLLKHPEVEQAAPPKVAVLASDWWTSHRPNGPDDDAGGPLHDLDRVFPDVYERMSLYDHGEPGFEEASRTIRRARGNPSAQVTIYRSMPAQYAQAPLGTGDWVGVSLAYTRQHGTQIEEADDWPVMKYTVRADQCWSPGDSLQEWGYWGPPVRGTVAFAGGKNQRVGALVAESALPEGIVWASGPAVSLYGSPIPGEHEVRATLDGKTIGWLRWLTTVNPNAGVSVGMISQVGVMGEYHRRGIATELLRRAREIEPRVHHSRHLTEDGRAWAQHAAAKMRSADGWEVEPIVLDGKPVFRVKHGPYLQGYFPTIEEVAALVPLADLEEVTEPKVARVLNTAGPWYHGCSLRRAEEVKAAGRGFGAGYTPRDQGYGAGLYLTNQRATAEGYAARQYLAEKRPTAVVEIDPMLKNPFICQYGEPEWDVKKAYPDEDGGYIERLKRHGHDALIIPFRRDTWCIVLDPAQVRYVHHTPLPMELVANKTARSGRVTDWRPLRPLRLEQVRGVPRGVLLSRDGRDDIENDAPPQIRKWIEDRDLPALAAGKAALEAKRFGPLVGSFTIDVRDDAGHDTGYRIGCYVSEQGPWIVYWVGPHTYDEAQKRMASTEIEVTGPDTLGDYLVLARDGGRVVGALRGGRYNAVERIFVLPSHRRRGIATRLYRALEQAAGTKMRAPDEFSESGAAWFSSVTDREHYSTWGSEPDWSGWLRSLGAVERTFVYAEVQSGGSKWPTQATLTCRVGGGAVAVVRFFLSKTKRKILIDRLESYEKRQGHASALMDELQRRFPDASIDHGDRTDDGKAWWSAYTRGKSVRRGRTAAARTVRLYHGTNEVALAAIRRDGQFRPADHAKIAHDIEDRYGLARDSVWTHPAYSFNRGFRAGDPKVYFTQQPEIARSYAETGSEAIGDGLGAAWQLLHAAEIEALDGNFPPGRTAWIEEQARAHYAPVVLTVEMPWEVLEANLWKDNRHPSFTPPTFETFVEMSAKHPWTTLALPAPLPARYITSVQKTSSKNPSQGYDGAVPRQRTADTSMTAAKTKTLWRGEGSHEHPSPYVTMGKPELAGAFWTDDRKMAEDYASTKPDGVVYRLEVTEGEYTGPSGAGANQYLVRDPAVRARRVRDTTHVSTRTAERAHEVKGWVSVTKMVADHSHPEANEDGRVATPGPWHALSLDGGQPLAWCGSKVTGFNKRRVPAGKQPPAGEPRCPACERAIRAGQPKAYSRR